MGSTGLIGLLMSLLLLTPACSTGLSYDPVFVAVGTPRESSGACPAESTCVEVPLTGLVEAGGRSGQCEIYTSPGDPATMEPLVSEVVEVPAAADADEFEIPFVWQTTIPADVDPSRLNPVCAPMIEG